MRIVIFLIFILLIILPFSSLLNYGYFPMHDDMQAMRLLQMRKCLDDFQIPCRWVPDMGYGYGYPQFNFYPPLPYYIMTLFTYFSISYLDAVKIGFILTFIISGLGMYLFSKQLWGHKGALISTIFYLYLPYRATNVYARGAMGEIWAMSWFPWIFWSLDMLIKTNKNKYLVILGITSSALALSHLLSAMMIAPFIIIWLFNYYFNRQIGLKTTYKIALSGLLAFGISAFYLLPVLFEQKYAHLETLTQGYFDYQAHFVSLRQMFLSTYWDYGSSLFGTNDEMSFSIGLLHWTIPAVSVIIGLLTSKLKFKTFLNSKLFLVSLLLFTGIAYLFLIHPRSVIIWKSIEPLKMLQFPWRFLAPAGFIFSLAAGSITIWHSNIKYKSLLFIVIPLFILNFAYFKPAKWLNINDQQHFADWSKLQTISIFDYLPIYANYPPTSAAPDMPEIISGMAIITEYIKGSDWQSGRIEVKETAEVKLPLFDFPGMSVFVNDSQTEFNHDNELGLITIVLPPGNYQILAELQDTHIRSFSNFITLITLIILIIFISNPLKLYEKIR